MPRIATGPPDRFKNMPRKGQLPCVHILPRVYSWGSKGNQFRQAGGMFAASWVGPGPHCSARTGHPLPCSPGPTWTCASSPLSALLGSLAAAAFQLTLQTQNKRGGWVEEKNKPSTLAAGQSHLLHQNSEIKGPPGPGGGEGRRQAATHSHVPTWRGTGPGPGLPLPGGCLHGLLALRPPLGLASGRNKCAAQRPGCFPPSPCGLRAAMAVAPLGSPNCPFSCPAGSGVGTAPTLGCAGSLWQCSPHLLLGL